eukprot:TRINITY_DN11513_c1_g2_i1.p1 TRINITY_DN11513_c1_g2~~TRINITY_DN11513_c1_g2_i1.p1  ORF type:complete len:200 (+),score=-37.21 TRINITY_DN11513_c1_g2_i1:185-784(+)
MEGGLCSYITSFLLYILYIQYINTYRKFRNLYSSSTQLWPFHFEPLHQRACLYLFTVKFVEARHVSSQTSLRIFSFQCETHCELSSQSIFTRIFNRNIIRGFIFLHGLYMDFSAILSKFAAQIRYTYFVCSYYCYKSNITVQRTVINYCSCAIFFIYFRQNLILIVYSNLTSRLSRKTYFFVVFYRQGKKSVEIYVITQ